MHESTLAQPANPMAAVSHADPFPYYRQLREQRSARRWTLADVARASEAATSDLRSRPATNDWMNALPVQAVALAAAAAEALMAQGAALGFGAGAHACPGAAVATEMVAACVRWIRAGGQFDAYFWRRTGFRPLSNARIPVFTS